MKGNGDIKERIRKVFPPHEAEVLVELAERTEETVKAGDFNELKEIVRELAEAQKRTEERLNAFEKSTEENFNRVWKAINELTEAQKRTEQRVNELAEAQKRTEEEIRRLVKGQREIREELGGLSHTVGYRLEDESYKALPKLLKKEFGIEVRGRLKRDFIETGPERYIEVNIWGEGIKDGKEYIIIGEAKTQLKKGDIEQFLKKADRIKQLIQKEQVRLLVTYTASPQVQRYAKEKGIKIYFSYEF